MSCDECTCTPNDVCYPCYASAVSSNDGLPDLRVSRLREAVALHRLGLISNTELYAVIEAHS